MVACLLRRPLAISSVTVGPDGLVNSVGSHGSTSGLGFLPVASPGDLNAVISRRPSSGRRSLKIGCGSLDDRKGRATPP
jgi:hypothetical protein